MADFANDPLGLAAELRNQAGSAGFSMIAFPATLPDAESLKACVMTGSWSIIGGHANVSTRITDTGGSLITETSASAMAWISASRTARVVASKIYTQLGYKGFNEAAFQLRIEREYPSRPTLAVTEDAIKKVEPHGLEGIWADSQDRYRLGIVPSSDTSSLDYVAVVLSSNSPLWRAGEIKAEIRATAAPDIFTCTYYMQNKKPAGTTLTLEHASLLRGSPINLGSEPFNLLLMRVWPKTSDQNAPQAKPSTVSSGTGFLITHSGLIATNWHVVEDAKTITVTFPNWSSPAGADVVVKDKINDLALLRVNDASRLSNTCRDLPFQLTTSSAVTLGERISTIGYPLRAMLGSNPKFAEGVVSSKSGLQDDPRWLQVSAQVQPGSSGSPLFDGGGNVIGVVVARLSDSKVFEAASVIPQNINFAIKSDYLLSLFSMVSSDSLAVRTADFSPEKASQCVAIVQGW